LERDPPDWSQETATQETEETHELSFYVDTNIFDYSALAHPVYGKACKHVIDDIQNRRIEAYCGFLVPIELLGSLARIDAEKAQVALAAFFSLPINMIRIDERTLEDAAKIIVESRVSYDSVHAACMLRKGLDTIITEDVSDWRKIKNIKIVRPLEYERLVKTEKWNGLEDLNLRRSGDVTSVPLFFSSNSGSGTPANPPFGQPGRAIEVPKLYCSTDSTLKARILQVSIVIFVQYTRYSF
jgi:predicted nucleic acid-binding protein